ncbi:MAG: nucleoside deaminase [Pseudomonadota bacterium]
MDKHLPYMNTAMEEAKSAAMRDEVPIGAVLVDHETGKIVAKDSNRTIELNDPSAHAEMLVIRKRCAELGVQRIPGHTLYVTLEPCTMCAAAISFARIDKVVIATEDKKGGGVLNGVKFYEQPTCHHRPDIEKGPLSQEASQILKEFFKKKR